MQLIIRTQSKVSLVDVTNKTISLGGYGENGKIFLMNNMGRAALTLGEYPTKERALEVLGEIAKAWNKTEQAKIRASDVAITPSFVYQMPQE